MPYRNHLPERSRVCFPLGSLFFLCLPSSNINLHVSGRKPKIALLNADSSANNTDAPKAKRVRKPRDPNAPPPRPRKKKEPLDISGVREGFGQPNISNPDAVRPDHNFGVPADMPAPPPSQTGKNEDIQRPTHSFFNPSPPPPPPPQHQPPQHQPPQHQQHQHQLPGRTSGQNYDPIRSNYDPVRETIINHSYGNSQNSPSHPSVMNRASASPSIASLVDPPNQPLMSPSMATQSFFNHQQRLYREDGHNSVPPSPTANRLGPAVVLESQNVQKPPNPTPPGPPKNSETVAQPAPAISNISKVKSIGNTATSTPGASPKPYKLKEPKDIYPTPPPLPGQGAGPSDGTEFRAPTVVLNVPLNGEVNQYVNFTRLAEDQYGWDALHPRLAAQRDRLARVAAAGAALERNATSRESGDEMSLDSDAEGSNAEMGGMSDARTGTDGGAKKIPRKRKMKEDEYDKDDGFVDDSELLWEEQAAAANDGFFVYSGPLVPEVQKPVIELRYVDSLFSSLSIMHHTDTSLQGRWCVQTRPRSRQPRWFTRRLTQCRSRSRSRSSSSTRTDRSSPLRARLSRRLDDSQASYYESRSCSYGAGEVGEREDGHGEHARSGTV